MRAANVSRGLGFDASVEVTPETAGLFLCSGYRFCVRYLRRDIHVNDRTDKAWPSSLSRYELDGLLRVNMPVSLVQFGMFNGDRLVPGYGHDIGTAAGTNAQLLGAPRGIVVWCDAEWTTKHAPSGKLPSPASVWQYLCEWAERVEACGYEPGLYVGPGITLTGRELYGLPKFRHYWRAASIVPQVKKRGFQMIQGLTYKVHGLDVDQNMACLDHFGDRFKLISR